MQNFDFNEALKGIQAGRAFPKKCVTAYNPLTGE